MATKTDYRVVGTRPIRHDGYDKVTGKALFGADMNLPGMIFGQVLRSPHAHAKILSIDTSRAEADPNVLAVVTSKDYPELANEAKVLNAGPPINLFHMSSNIMARSKALYKGHAVAAVAANSVHAAEKALSLIDVKYEVLSSASTVEESMKPGAEMLHDQYEGNVASHNQVSVGDVEEGFRQADFVVEREFRTKTVHQGYLEPHSATAWWLADGRITIWSSSQGHFPVRDRTAAMLGIPSSRIKAIPMEIGGGFGGKTVIYLEPVATMLSKKTGHPVKITMSRADVLEASGPTSGSYMKIKMGATKDGKITSAQATLMYEAGAFPGSPVGAATGCIFTPYNVDNALIDAYDVVTNKPKTTAYRAPGVPGAAFAGEQVVDELARKVGMDPLEFRIKNGAKEGTRRANGLVNPPIGNIETLESARGSDHYKSKLEGKYRGRGVANGFWPNGSGPACATANVNFDGTVNLTIGSVDIGGIRPNAAMQLAEVLGIAAEDVNPQVGDTDSIGYTSMTGGSGAAFKTGWASFEAAQDVKQQMMERAALLWETDVTEVDFSDGVFQRKSDPTVSMNFKEMASKLPETGGPVVGRANLSPAGPGGSFACHVVDVEVDPDTGKVEILRYTASQDVGTAIHPAYVEGQIQGGVVQGIGWALNEEYFMNEQGSMVNSSLLDYRMPTALDIPMIEAVIVEVPNPTHPYGVRGVGEVCIVPPMAAIANAIQDAVGVRMESLPMNPQSVLKAMQEKKH